jgi:hypothetical protein
MAALWILLGLLAVGGGLAVARSMQTMRNELTPTIEAFARMRAAIAPATVAVGEDTRRLRTRLDDREAGRPHPHG